MKIKRRTPNLSSFGPASHPPINLTELEATHWIDLGITTRIDRPQAKTWHARVQGLTCKIVFKTATSSCPRTSAKSELINFFRNGKSLQAKITFCQPA